MNFKQFRKPGDGHSRAAIAGGRVVGGRGFRLMSKPGRSISVQRLERLLADAYPQQARQAPKKGR